MRGIPRGKRKGINIFIIIVLSKEMQGAELVIEPCAGTVALLQQDGSFIQDNRL